MIRQEISKTIWNKKYRFNKETEKQFHKRLSEGLFENVSRNDLECFNKIVQKDIKKLTEKKFSSHLCSLAGRGLYALGTNKTKQTFSNCFVLDFKKDSLSAIMETAHESALTMKAGGGVGYSISILRPSSIKIKSSDSYSSGAVSFLKILDATCSVIKAGGDRRGAQLCALGVWHPSIKEFIRAKRTGDLSNFNLSVFVSDEFMETVINDSDWDLVFPDTDFEKYDSEWDGNIKSWKEKGYPIKIHETIKAKKLFKILIQSNYDFAEPGVLFEDNINSKNNLFFQEYIQTTNPCITGDGKVKIKLKDNLNPCIKTISEVVFYYISGVKMEILSYNLKEGIQEYKPILFAGLTKENAKILKIQDLKNFNELKCTPDHKIYTQEKIGIEAKDLDEQFYEITNAGREDVFDITVQDNHNFFVNNILVHNCGEQPLAPAQSCNLGPINISNHVKNPFSDKSEFDWELFKETIKIITIALNQMIDKSFFPLESQLKEVQEKRLIGIGFTGLEDAMVKLKIKYNSDEGIIFSEQIMKTIKEVGFWTSAELAKYFGTFPVYDEKILESFIVSSLPEDLKEKIKKQGLRNSRITSVAPNGTTSIFMNNCSSGIEPIFALEYTRHIKQDDGTIKKEMIKNDAWNLFKNSKYYNNEIPDYFVQTDDLNLNDHINIQSVVQKHCCTSISKTINLPVDIKFEDFKDVYMKAWKKGLKGCTTYRPNSILGTVLEIKKEQKQNTKSAKKELKEFYSAWKEHKEGIIIQNVELPSEYPMRGYKITSEGKKWYVHLAFSDKQCKMPFAIFVTTNAKESKVDTFDCIEKLQILAKKQNIKPELIQENIDKMQGQSNVNKLSRTLGLLMRHNVKLIDIIKVLDNVPVPVSSFIFRIKKFLLTFIEEIPSNGEKCPDCGTGIEFKEGCKSCPECFWSKCS